MRRRVLLVAADLDLRARFARELHSSGYAVELACDVKRALALVAVNRFGVAIVAPGSGPAGSATILTLRDNVSKMIVVAESASEIARLRHSLPGVDEFLSKSANEGALGTLVSEMIALTDSAIGDHATAPSVMNIGDCKLDLSGHVFIAPDGKEVALTRAEADLLTELARNPCQVVSRDKLRYAVAGRGTDPFDRSMDMLVARVRRKIEPDQKVPRFLLTAPGVGYKLMARTSAETRQFRGEPIEPERRQITALCCQLVGAVALALEVDPEDLSRITQNFQDAAVAAIARMGGKIAATTHHEIQAFFGWPEAHEDDAERAVTAGLDAVAQIGRFVSSEGKPLQARVTVATGLALASHKLAVGEPLVIAAGMCDQAVPNSVLVTASTRRLLSGAFVCETPEPYAIVGVSKTIRACRVSGKRGVACRFKGKHSSEVTRLIGREQELQRLLAHWDRTKRGQGQVALVSGEAGIGKSHLCEFLLGQLAKERHFCIRYQCSPHHLNSPFYPVVSQLELAVGLEQADTPALRFEKLKASLSQAVAPTKEDILLYATLLSIAAPEREAALGLTAQRQKDLTIAALVRHLLGFADKGPLVVAFADAHWADSSTLELISRLIPLIKTARVLLLITFRPEFVPQWLDEPHVTSLCLDRMGRDQCHDIISDVIGSKALPREVEEQIVDKADGIPLFVEELAKSVLESELLQDADRRSASGPLPALKVPATLLDSLTARLDQLGPAKEVAQIGAVIGREFSRPLLLAAAAPRSINLLESTLAQLISSGVIFQSSELPNATYTFKHALVRDAAYATLCRDKRQRLHSRVAEVLETNFSLTIETRPELLAHHFEQAGLIERAIDYLRKAGERSIERSANAEAIGHLTRAVQLLKSCPDNPQYKPTAFALEVMLSQAMIANYGYAAPKPREALVRARALIDDSTDALQKFSVLYGLWASYYVAAELPEQRNAAREFLAEAERANEAAVLCVAHRLVGTTYVQMGEFADGAHHLKLARGLYNSERHVGYHQFAQDIGSSALCYLSWALWHLGYVDQASEVASEAMKLAEGLSHPHTLVFTMCHARGFMDIFRRRSEDMSSYAQSVISICKENGFLHWLNCGMVLDGWAATRSGQLDRGIEALRKGVVGWQKLGARLWMPMFLTLEAEAYINAGRSESALKAIEQALLACENTGERWAMAEVLRVKARILLLAGKGKNYREIEAILLNSLEIAQRQEARCWELRACYDLARLWQHEGRNAEALKLLQSVYDQFTEGFDTPDLRDAQALLRALRRNLAHGRDRLRVEKDDRRTAIQ